MNVLTILNELAASAGQDTVRAACTQFLGGKKVKKERKPRGKSSWNLEVDAVLGEMRTVLVAAGESEESIRKKATYKMAYAEASRRRKEKNPEKYLSVDAAPVVESPAGAPARTVDDMDFGDTPPDTDEDDEGGVVDGVPETYDAGQVYRFLFDLQESGHINMLACPPELQARFGMTRQEADDVRAEYMKRYSELKAKYAPVTTPQRRVSTTFLAPSAPKKPLSATRTKIPIV